jgi:3-deoxy-D-manno-octulosonic-acid transferase
MRFLYSLLIQFHACIIKWGSPFSEKAKFWSAGRKKIFPLIEKNCAGKNNIVWFHCASLGEFEQGKPLMEKIKQEEKNCTLFVTFFSPSGFEIKKNDPIADAVTYLPIDTPKNAKRFIKMVNPQKVFFVKYEYWYNYIYELSKNKIPFYYVSANFRENQYFFKKFGGWFLLQLKKCAHFFVQNEKSQKILNQHGIFNVTVTGDSRFDRVFAIAQQPYTLDFICSFKSNKKLLVAGSTWQPDEKLLAKLFQKIHPDYQLVLAPHMVDKNHIVQVKKTFASFSVVCFSEKESKNLSDYEVLIIDTIGILSKIYKYADISYIGGAFKTGLHNILEAAVFAKPLFFGPHYQRFNEALELVARGAAFSIKTAGEIENKLGYFENNLDCYQTCCEICREYVTQNLGATDKILKNLYLPTKKPLTTIH